MTLENLQKSFFCLKNSLYSQLKKILPEIRDMEIPEEEPGLEDSEQAKQLSGFLEQYENRLALLERKEAAEELLKNSTQQFPGHKGMPIKKQLCVQVYNTGLYSGYCSVRYSLVRSRIKSNGKHSAQSSSIPRSSSMNSLTSSAAFLL